MGYIGKGAVRTLVIGTLVVGGVAIVAEWARPGSVRAMAGQAKSTLGGVLDQGIEDPVALRAQIRALEAEYPKRIGEIRSDLTEVRQQIQQIEREHAISLKVAALAADDLESLDDGIARARQAAESSPGAIVRIAFQDRPVALADAYGRRQQISQTRSIYEQRAADLEEDLRYLELQENDLAELLVKLETERSEFQAKLFQLDAQIDAIARDRRMADMMEARQKTIDEHSRYRVHSLEQLNTRLTSMRSEQRGRLEAIAGRRHERDYVSEAEFLLGRERSGVAPEQGSFRRERSPERVIEIRPGEDERERSDREDGRVAARR